MTIPPEASQEPARWEYDIENGVSTATYPGNVVYNGSGGGGNSGIFDSYASAQAYSPAQAPDFIILAGYYSAGDNGGAIYVKVDSEPSHAGKLYIILSDGTKVWYAITGAELTEVMFGTVTDGDWNGGGTDSAVTLQNWASCPVSLHKRFTGASKSSVPIEFLAGTTLEGADDVNYGIDFSTITDPGTAPGYIYVDQSSSLVQISNLSANITDPTQVPMTSVAGISPGDYICLYNPTNGSWIGSRTYYRAGEWFRVGFISGNTLTPTDPLWHLYNASDMNVYKLSGPQVIMRNFRVQAPYLETAAGIFVNCSIQPIIENVRAPGTAYTNIELSRCIEINVNCNLFQLEDTGTVGDEYGLTIANCCRGRIRGQYHSQRHGIAMGGGDVVCCVPNREIIIEANTFNYASVPSLDVGHGCNEGLQVIGGNHAGILVGGANLKVVNAYIRKGSGQGNETTGPGNIVYGSEFYGGNFEFDGCVFDSLVNCNVVPGPISVFFTQYTSDLCRLYLRNCQYNNVGGSSSFVNLTQDGSTFGAVCVVDGANVQDPSNALTVGLVQLHNANVAGGSINFDLARIVNVYGDIASNMPRAAIAGSPSPTVAKWQFDDQFYEATFTPTTSEAAGSIAVNHPWPYPTGVSPNLSINQSSRTVGGKVYINWVSGASNTSSTIGFQTADAANFSSTVAGQANVRAYLQ